MRACILLAVAAVCFFPHQSANAEIIIGLTSQNSLISFDSATPGSVSTIGAITGLTAGDILVGIDRRPQLGPNNGRIYGLGVNFGTGTGRIYTVSEIDATATLISTLFADPSDTTAPFPFTTVTGTSFGIDFNPVPDRLRAVSNTGQNLRINVDNGLVQLDVPLSFVVGDPNFGDSPVIAGIAYSNNFGGATSSVLRGVDIGQNPDALVLFSNPNGGVLQTSLDLPFNSGLTGYDISGFTGTPYFSITPAGSLSSSLFAAGAGGVSLVGTIGGGVSLVDIAAPVGEPVPEPATVILSMMGLIAIGLLRRRFGRTTQSA